MSAHKTLDDDLQHPPPSAQRVAWAAGARRSGTAVTRPIARSRRDVHQPTVANNAAEPFRNLQRKENPVIDSAPNTCTSAHDERAASSSSTMPVSTVTVISHHSDTTKQPALLAPTPRFFDAWNSSSTGHQRAENRLSGSTSWRQSRNLKLGEQYKGGLTGGKRVRDTVGAGSEHFGKDGRKDNGGWQKGAKGLRDSTQRSLAELWVGDGKNDKTSNVPIPQHHPLENTSAAKADQEFNSDLSCKISEQPKLIFDGLCFYLNGSTAPLISDHRLKHIVSSHGGTHSISLSRRTVTHVILGAARGGGLSASKMQKEIAKTKKKGVRFVTADWVLSSVEANRRLPEAHFSSIHLASKAQTSIFQKMVKKPSSS
ncbi:unnamed protein product [Periconia digitata]|uniref:BRCT domain-containing protein n=1 Tax=Periconia digitata TaxID=1303443 RepID=A0A9W4UFB5_9PLEO|nr:unnamed protein product [Periconia digitata]